MYPIK